MISQETADFIARYGDSSSRERIRFDWNKKHGNEFSDTNSSFRRQVAEAVLAASGQAPLNLICDLFEAEALCSKEAWCISLSFAPLGGLLLTRGGIAVLDLFAANCCASFDSYTASHTMNLDPVTVAALYAETARRLKESTDEIDRKRLAMTLDLFGKYRNGNPGKNVVMLSGDKLKGVKVKVVSGPRRWLAQLKRLLP
jgi:hypothetical protein